jgi:hypothetical protein
MGQRGDTKFCRTSRNKVTKVPTSHYTETEKLKGVPLDVTYVTVQRFRVRDNRVAEVRPPARGHLVIVGHELHE